MPTQKRSNKAVETEKRPAVLNGDVFRSFVAEAQSIGNEVTARRAFDADVGEYLESKGLVSDFEAWRAKKHMPKKA